MTADLDLLRPGFGRRRLRDRRHRGAWLMVFVMLAGMVTLGFAASAEEPDISARRAAERKTFSDTEITDGYLKIALGAEYPVDKKSVDRIRKFVGPVRVFIDSRAKPDRRAQVAAVIADIRERINHLDIAVTKNREAANVVVTLVRDRDLNGTIRKFYGRERARMIQRSLDPQCLSGIGKDDNFQIVRSDVIIVVDAGNSVFYDCVYEEILQALGPINDVDIPWTMFNDKVQMGFFDIFDQYLLNIHYDPRIRPGMTKEEVRAVLPEVLPDVRAFVARKNELAP
jgi:hypothetical protein